MPGSTALDAMGIGAAGHPVCGPHAQPQLPAGRRRPVSCFLPLHLHLASSCWNCVMFSISIRRRGSGRAGWLCLF